MKQARTIILVFRVCFPVGTAVDDLQPFIFCKSLLLIVNIFHKILISFMLHTASVLCSLLPEVDGYIYGAARFVVPQPLNTFFLLYMPCPCLAYVFSSLQIPGLSVCVCVV